MRIWFTSDNHVDTHARNWQLWELLLARAQTETPDLLIVGGDLSESLSTLQTALGLFSELPCLKVFVPGNHDLWCRHDSKNSTQKLESELPRICEQTHWHWLPSQPLNIGPLGLAGSPSWYDYSLLPDRHPFSLQELVAKTRGARTFMDVCYCSFKGLHPLWHDIQLTHHFEDELRHDLKSLSAAKAKLVITHFPMQRKFLNFTQQNWEYEFFGAFMGSATSLRLLEEEGVDLHLSGHLHRQREVYERGVRAMLSPVGYTGEWELADPELWLNQRLLQLDIDSSGNFRVVPPAQS